jgi:hypothetical protein
VKRSILTTAKGYPFYQFTDLDEAREAALESAHKRLAHVEDTWLARTEEARLQNLLIGYLAQEVVEEVFRREKLPFISYDSTRVDDSENDDPFDFIVLPPGTRDVSRIVAQLQREFYVRVNSQGRFRRPDLVEFRDFVLRAGGYVCDLKSSVDNHHHGIDAICHGQHHIAYATQKNDAGFVVVTGREYLEERGQTFEQYCVRKQAIKDVHFRVFFSDSRLDTAYYVGFIRGRELVESGEVGPFPGMPWVLYHRVVVADAYPPGSEQEVLFGG